MAQAATEIDERVSEVPVQIRDATGAALAAINFAGGGNPATRPGNPCSSQVLAETFGAYGRTVRAPTLWGGYTENDLYFGPRYTRAWFSAYRTEGGYGGFLLLPAFGDNGHRLFTRGFDLWAPIVQRFLPTLNAVGQ